MYLIFDFAGRKVVLPRPRVRTVGGQEARLPLVEQLRESDPMAQRVVEQILLGVSTRGYEASLGQLPSSLRKQSDSKSSASRRLIEETNRRMSEFVSCSLEGIRYCVIMIDGIVVAKRSVIVVLGVDDAGKKYPLGLRLGSTENSTVCAELLQ